MIKPINKKIVEKYYKSKTKFIIVNTDVKEENIGKVRLVMMYIQY